MDVKSRLGRAALAALIITTAFVFALIQLRARAVDPAGVVTQYYSALKSANYQAAARYIAGKVDPEWFEHAVNTEGGLSFPIAIMLFGKQPMPEREIRLNGCKSNLKNIGTASEMYSTDNSGRYERGLSALTPNYLRLIPTCPAASRDTYSGAYRSAANPDAFTVACSGSNHSDAGVAANYPMYTSSQGLAIVPPDVAHRVEASAPFAVKSFRILGQTLHANTATVHVDEIYAVHGFPTHVTAELPLCRTAQGWRIDGERLYRARNIASVWGQSRTANIPAAQMSTWMTRLGAWMRIQGVGVSFAAIAAYQEVPALGAERRQGQLDACESNLKNVGTALEMYATDAQGVYPPTLALVTPNYLKFIPTCPAAKRDTYSEGYTSHMHPDAYTVVCAGDNHKGLSAPNYPQYSSAAGLIDKKP